MRTPGEDRALAAGFLLSEGVVRTADDIGAVEHCRHPDRPDAHNVVDVYLLGRVAGARSTPCSPSGATCSTNSSCGLCGRVTIDSLQDARLALPMNVDDDGGRSPRRCRTVCASASACSTETGGLHAAGLFTRDRSVRRVRGGRRPAQRRRQGHRGDAARRSAAARRHALAVSGRTSFEIVQKAWLAGVGLLCAVSAPSSLAIELADEAGITLLGFVRDGGFNVYTHLATDIAG